MFRTVSENIDYIQEYTIKMLKVIAFALSFSLVLAIIIGLIIWSCAKTDQALAMYEQELNREKAVEQLTRRM